MRYEVGEVEDRLVRTESRPFRVRMTDGKEYTSDHHQR